jgi:hypothetical protein
MSRDASDLARHEEWDADRFAVEHAPEFIRTGVLWGASFFLWLYGCYEAVIGRNSDHHPPAEERMTQLIQQFKSCTTAHVVGRLEQLRDFVASERATFSCIGENVTSEMRVHALLNGLSPRRAAWLLKHAVEKIYAN